ncbi:MAG: S1C family serine protease [Muribaculaceae bacterium]
MIRWIEFIFLILCLFGCRESASQQQSNSRAAVGRDDACRQSRQSANRSNKRSATKLEGQEIFDMYETAVFMIFTGVGISGKQGSGFFIDSNGLAVSNYHVFQGTASGTEKIKLSGQDCSYTVSEIFTYSEEEDFILFRVNCKNTNYLPIASTKPRIGEKVYAIGSPLGLENTFSSGEVSQWRGPNRMQISALIDHGSSGGALINEYGEVVGITSGTFADGSQANLNYAWSIDVIKTALNTIH